MLYYQKCFSFLLGFFILCHPLVLAAEGPKPFSQEQTLEETSLNDEDPLEEMNRLFFELNTALDVMLVRPLILTYRTVVPSCAQEGVHNTLSNLMSPVYMLNHLAQGRVEDALHTLSRCILNTFFGCLGLFDLASEVDLPEKKNTFGDTLKSWGATPGFYLVLPILGPSCLRELVGMGADYVVDPFNLWAWNQKKRDLVSGRYAAELIDVKSRWMDEEMDIHDTALDPYAMIRSIYLQKVRKKR